MQRISVQSLSSKPRTEILFVKKLFPMIPYAPWCRGFRPRETGYDGDLLIIIPSFK